ncbi:MAG: helix-turn-helix domain-containing protein [Methanobrevibacter sp.]|jgi:DNA-binding phage protein|nr:helix-turn-helix domain-containing protein [Methanobrevibacter sp.]
MFYILFNLKNKKISQLAKETGLTRQTIYRIKKLFKEKNTNRKKK